MFKLSIVCALLAVVAARPDVTVLDVARSSEAAIIPLKSAATIVQEPAVAKIGEYVKSIPTAVSHQSSTIVHDRANVVTPILAPVLRDYNIPLLRSYYPGLYPYSFNNGYYTYYTAPTYV